MMKHLMIWLAGWSFGLGMATAGPAFQPVTAFEAGPAGPEGSGLLKHSDGYYYGTSRSGGAFGHGTIYRVNLAGEVAVMVHFSGNSGVAKGRRPQAGLVDDGSGVLWGTTFLGGAGNFGDGYGTVFRFNPVTKDFTSIVAFTGVGGFAKGSNPQAGLERDGAGHLWGTTTSGGSGGAGTVFKVNPVNLVFSTVLDFTGNTGANRGRAPQASLTRDGSGLLWGTTAEGGSNGLGTLFTLDPSTSTLSTLFDFTGGAGAFPGSRPGAALLAGSGGVWWGTTTAGGAGGHGTVFRYTAAGGGFSSVAVFTGSAGAVPGRQPATALVLNGADTLLGTTNFGGANDYGTIFKINANTMTFSNLVQFTGAAGAVPGIKPYGALVAADGAFFRGVTTGDGTNQLGGVYKIDGNTGAVSPVAGFVRTLGSTPASNPGTGLIAGGDGLLWGTSEKGGVANAGTIFTFNPVTGVTAGVVEFTGTTGAVRGFDPVAELTSDGTGHLWGCTVSGGVNDLGVVFKINVLTKIFTAIWDFDGAIGRNPSGRLLADGNGFLWGTTAEGGSGLSGTVFKISIATGVLTNVVQFTGISGDFPGDGGAAGLMNDGAGFVWGTTYEGGELNFGTVFKIALATGTYSHVLSFTGTDGGFKGNGPGAVLASGAGGFLWGTTGFGGTDDLGTVFKIDRVSGEFTTVVEFTGPNGDQNGANPASCLIQDPVGAWYGTTEAGGNGVTEAGGRANLGTLFKIEADGTFRTIYEFTGALGAVPGSKPRGALFAHSDGHFYGAASAGGVVNALTPAGNGQIFRLHFGPMPVTLPATTIHGAGATLRGSVNPVGAASTVTFEYGTSPTLAGATVVAGGLTSAASVAEPVSLDVTGLLSSTVYYYRVRAQNPENVNLQRAEILSFSTTSGTAAGFVNWLNTAGVPGGVEEAGGDADLDGIPNAVEFVLGGNPTQRDTPAMPEMLVTPDDLIYRFYREEASKSPDVTLLVETGSVLSAWPGTYTIGPSTGTSSGGVVVEENGPGADFVTVTIPRAGSPVKFVRLNVVIAP